MTAIKTTIKDIAVKLGISAKTVSMALNNRGEVSKGLQEKIIETAKAMNYIPNRNAAALSRSEIRIISIAPVCPVEYYSFVNEGIRDAAAELENLHCVIDLRWYADPNAHEEIRDILHEINCSGELPAGIVIACSYETDTYIHELNQLSAKGIPILFNTLAADNAASVGRVGLNTYMAGKMAAEYLTSVTHSTGENFAVLTGNVTAAVHKGCIDGFISETGRVAAVLNTYEDRAEAERLTVELLNGHTNIKGIYVSSYNAVGVCDGIRKVGLTGQISVVGHDLYPDIIRCLKAKELSAVLFQNQYEYGRESLWCMYEYLAGIRTAERCRKLHTPQLILRCMADEYVHYQHLPDEKKTGTN